MTTATSIFDNIRAALAAAGPNLPGRKAQDIAFELYDLAEGETLTQLQAVLTLSLVRLTFDSAEIEALVAEIEAAIVSPTP